MDAKKPVERRKLPPETEQPCTQTDTNAWVGCMIEKARRVDDLKEQDHAGEKIERERRRACVEFIENELP